MRFYFLALCVCVFVGLSPTVRAQDAPPGWKVTRSAPEGGIYTPTDLAPDQGYSVLVLPRTTLNGVSLEDRLLETTRAATLSPGATATPVAVQSRAKNIVIASRVLTIQRQKVSDLFIGLAGAGGSAQVVRVMATAGQYDRYRKATLGLVDALARSLSQAAAPSGAVPPDAAPPPAVQSPPAVRGPGVKPSQIAGVYAHTVNRTGVGGYFYQVFEPLLAFKDGTYCEDFEVPPSEFDAAGSRRRSPSHWGRWRFNASVGGGHWYGSAKHIQTLSGKGVWETSDWIGPLPGGGAGGRLSGTYHHTGGSGDTATGGGTYAISVENLTFFLDGHFQSADSSSAHYGELNTFPDVPHVSASGHSHEAGAGTYTVGDYILTLRFGDGTVRRWSFARDPSGMLYLHGEAYYTDRKALTTSTETRAPD